MIGYSTIGFNLVEVSPHFSLVLNTAYQDVVSNLDTLQSKFDSLTSSLHLAEIQRSNDHLSSLTKKGLRHLFDGINSNNEEVREIAFTLAYSSFTELISFTDYRQELHEVHAPLQVNYACVGFWGNFHYFNLKHDRKSAAIQVYECASHYPRQAVRIFPVEFFKHDFQKLIDNTDKKISQLRNRLGGFAGLEETLNNCDAYLQMAGYLLTGHLDQAYEFIADESDRISSTLAEQEDELSNYLTSIIENSKQCLLQLEQIDLEAFVKMQSGLASRGDHSIS